MAINPKMLSKLPMPSKETPAMQGEVEGGEEEMVEGEAPAPIDLSGVTDEELLLEIENRGLNTNRG